MTTISITDKNHLTVCGVMDSARRLGKQEATAGGLSPPRKPDGASVEVKNAKKDLAGHLDALAAHGFTFEPTRNESVPLCRC